MVVTKTESSVCVELDTGRDATDYLKYVDEYKGQKPTNLKYDLSSSVFNE